MKISNLFCATTYETHCKLITKSNGRNLINMIIGYIGEVGRRGKLAPLVSWLIERSDEPHFHRGVTAYEINDKGMQNCPTTVMSFSTEC